MLDIKFIEDNPDQVKVGIEKKRTDPSLIDQVLNLNKERKDLLQKVEQIRAKKKRAEKKLIQTEDRTEKDKIIKALREAKSFLSIQETTLTEVSEKLRKLLLQLPLPPADDVPEGSDENDNVVVRSWGRIPNFSFTPQSYLDLMEKLDLVDLSRGVKIGGFRQYVLKNEAVILENAILRWSLDFLKKQGFTLFRPTVLVKESALVGTGMFPKNKEEVYKVDNDLYLAGTTEVPLMSYYAGEVLKEEQLPLKMAGISEAFRKEAGSYGKDTKGIIRVHEFIQTEQVILCKNSEEESRKWHEWLLQNSEKIMQLLKIPYRIVNCCQGELSSGQRKRYDVEAWVPSQNRYRETHSDSYLLDFQTRRLNIRYRDKLGKLHFVHSLNDTGIASPRILIPLIENYQTKEGFIKIPRILWPYTGGIKVIRSK